MKYPVYQIRVRVEMMEWLKKVGPDTIRGWWEEVMREGLPSSAPAASVAVAPDPAPASEPVVATPVPEPTPPWSKGKLGPDEALQKYRDDLQHDAEFGPGSHSHEPIDVTPEQRAEVAADLERQQKALAPGYKVMSDKSPEERLQQQERLKALQASLRKKKD